MQQMQIALSVPPQPAVDTKPPPRFFTGGNSWPELYRLAALWHGKRRGRFMPARSDLDPIELKPWAGWLSLVRVLDGGENFVFVVHGTHAGWVTGLALQGRTTEALPPSARLPVVESYRLACHLRRPLFSAMIARDDLHRRVVLERAILPLSADGVTVDRLLVGLGRHEIETDEIADYRHSLQGCDVTLAIIDP